MIKKAIEMEHDFLGWCRKMVRIATYDDYYTLKWILEDTSRIKNYLVVLQGTKIRDLIYVGEKYNILCVTPFFLGGTKQEPFTIKEIKKYYKDTLYILKTKWVDVEKYGYTICNRHSSIDLEHVLNMDNQNYSVLNPNNVNILRDRIEEKYLPTNIDKLNFEIIDGEEVPKYIYDKEEQDYPTWTGEGNHTTFIGFHYFGFNYNENSKFLIAKTCDEKIVGVIKYGRYSIGYDHYGINYIDVNSTCRGKGIASMMINELTKYIPSDAPLVLSYESELGKLCCMQQHFKNAKFNTTVFTDKEWEEHCLEQCFKKA